MAVEMTQEEWAWKSRNMGRIRLTEDMAKELNAVLTDEIIRRRVVYKQALEDGVGTREAKQDLRRIDKLRKANWTLMQDKGWVDS